MQLVCYKAYKIDRNYGGEERPLLSAELPFTAMRSNGRTANLLKILFYVIKGDHAFLLILPRIVAIGAAVNQKCMTTSFSFS